MGVLNVIKPERPVMKVCMMGPKAVGKTTVLTAVFNETQNAIAETQLNLIALGDTNSELIDRTHQLNAMFKKKIEVVDRPSGGINASSVETRFDFSFGFVGKEPLIDLVIKDFPGEMVVSRQAEVIDFIKESEAIFVAIDTPHLMERGGEFNAVKNKPDTIIQLFRQALQDITSEKLVVMIPLKCEKYFHEKRMPEVLGKVEQVYAPLIELFKENGNICCVVSPILTLGDVEFDDFSYENNTVRLAPDQCPDHVLYKYVGRCKYSPLFCSQPLYTLLSFVSAQYKRMKREGILDRLKNWIWNMFNRNEALFDEIIKMEKTRITQNVQFGYKILCGAHLFHYNH